MTNPYYNPTGTPGTGAQGASLPVRLEFVEVAAGFALLPTVTGNGNKAVVVNSGGTALTVTTGALALAGDFATTGAFNTTFAQTATTTLTLPAVTGTLATLAGTETLSNKTLVAPALGTPASGVLTNCTGTAASLTAGNVTTNANLTGPISSVGNATSITSQTGTGTTFVMSVSPTITGHPTIEGVISTGATGTGNFVFSISPTFTGTLTAATSSFTGHMTIEGVTSTGATGSGAFVFATSPTLVTPNIGAATLGGTLTGGTNTISGGSYKAALGTVNALGSITGSNAVDYSLGNYVTATQNNAAVTYTFTNWPASGTYGFLEIITILDATPHSVTFTGVTWDTNIGAPSLVASKKLCVVLETTDGGSTIRASLVGQF